MASIFDRLVYEPPLFSGPAFFEWWLTSRFYSKKIFSGIIPNSMTQKNGGKKAAIFFFLAASATEY